jgi:hypothetical protein
MSEWTRAYIDTVNKLPKDWFGDHPVFSLDYGTKETYDGTPGTWRALR